MMRVYTVHVRTPAERLDRDIHLVKEGFSWPAFFFSAVWARWVRLWLVAVVLIALDILWTFGGAWLGLPLLSTTAVSLALATVVGFIANDLRRTTLFRRGYIEVGVVAGRDRDSALQRFLDQHGHFAQGLVR